LKRILDIDAYLTGELSGAGEDAFEEALFDAPDDPDLAILDRIARHGTKLAAHGTFDMGVPKSHVDKLIVDGHIVQICDAGPPGAVAFTIRKDAELVVTCLPLGRTDHERVDVDVTLIELDVTKTIKDVMVDPGDGTVYGLCERPLAELAFGHEAIVRVRENHGRRAVLAEWHLVGNVAV
jgi:hypothetical protein